MSSNQNRRKPPHFFPLKNHKNTKKYSYELRSILGNGAFATVYKYERVSTKKVYACKIVYLDLLKNAQHKIKLGSEIKLHSSMQHKNIVQFYEHIVDKNIVFMILELCPNGSLHEIIQHRRKITEPEACFWFKQIVHAVKYLHGQRVIHRDLKLGTNNSVSIVSENVFQH